MYIDYSKFSVTGKCVGRDSHVVIHSRMYCRIIWSIAVMSAYTELLVKVTYFIKRLSLRNTKVMSGCVLLLEKEGLLSYMIH